MWHLCGPARVLLQDLQEPEQYMHIEQQHRHMWAFRKAQRRQR